MRSIASFLKKVIWNNYFAWTALFACLAMFSVEIFNYGNILTISLVYLGFFYFLTNKVSWVDYLVLFTLCFFVFLDLVYNVPTYLFRGGIDELLPMLAFFIGKNEK